MKIIVDAMGGDNAPQAIVQGAVDAQKEFGVDIVLVGREDAVRPCLAACGAAGNGHITVRPASEVITMSDDPSTATRHKKDASMTVALNMLRDGEGDAVVSAGSTGALLTGATLIVRRIRGIRRAALAPVLPNGGAGVMLIDCGANVECTPEYLLQFAFMGSYYAAASGETPQVAQAIGQHYQPRFAGDALPDTTVGKLVALADKLDTICGLFAVGQGPTGSSDPFALRRSAIGIVNMLETGLAISLAAAIDESLASFAAQGVAFDAAAVRAEVVDFFVTRTKVMLRDGGVNADTIDAVLAAGVEEPAVISQRAHALEDARANDAETFDNLATAYARANNLRKPELGEGVDDALLTEPERALAGAVATAEQAVAYALASDDFAAALSQLAALRAPIDGFFADVMVMDEDAALRDNRLRLLNRFVAVFANVADFGKMAKSK